jgi:hypothetical protein
MPAAPALRHLFASLCALLLLCAAPGYSADGHAHGGHAAGGAAGSPYAALAPFRCSGAGLQCATAASAPAWAADGSFWLAWAAEGAIAVARSADLGRTFSAPVTIGRHGDRLDIGPDALPQIALDAAGRIVVIYGVFRDDQWNAELRVSTSEDGGRHFPPPQPIGDNPASQRFPALALDPGGALFVAWIDKRLTAAAARQGRRMQAASIAYAWSDDGGKRFTAPAIAHAESCECCRIGAAVPAAGRPVLVFRDVFRQKVRDHALIAFTARDRPGPLRRVAVDDWVTDACPHHGPSLAVDGAGTLHVAWFTQGRRRSGVFYARSTDGGLSFSAPMPIGRAEQRAGRPYLLADGRTVWMTWKEFDGDTTTVHHRVSQDGGATWSAAAEAARTRGYSHHPMLTRHGGRTYLSWLSHDEGYRLIPLP